MNSVLRWIDRLLLVTVILTILFIAGAFQ